MRLRSQFCKEDKVIINASEEIKAEELVVVCTMSVDMELLK